MIVHNRNIADDAFRRRMEKYFGVPATADWRAGVPQELDAHQVMIHLANLVECQELIFKAIHPKPILKGPLGEW